MNRQQRRITVAKQQREGVMVHEIIEKRSKEMAALFYGDAASKSNNFYKAFPNEADFIATQWPDFIGHTKAALTQLLRPEMFYKTTEEQREQIYDVLCLDRTLPKSQSRGLM